jgi:hypothetical protein
MILLCMFASVLKFELDIKLPRYVGHGLIGSNSLNCGQIMFN